MKKAPFLVGVLAATQLFAQSYIGPFGSPSDWTTIYDGKIASSERVVYQQSGKRKLLAVVTDKKRSYVSGEAFPIVDIWMDEDGNGKFDGDDWKTDSPLEGNLNGPLFSYDAAYNDERATLPSLELVIATISAAYDHPERASEKDREAMVGATKSQAIQEMKLFYPKAQALVQSRKQEYQQLLREVMKAKAAKK